MPAVRVILDSVPRIIELTRVPLPGECLALESATHRVLSVTHTPCALTHDAEMELGPERATLAETVEPGGGLGGRAASGLFDQVREAVRRNSSPVDCSPLAVTIWHPLSAWAAFVAEVRDRLEAGRATYGDRSFEREPSELLAELSQEALDLAGWGFVLWQRIRALRERARGVVTR